MQQRDRGNPGVTASLLPQPPLRGVGGGGMEGCRDGEMKERERVQGQADLCVSLSELCCLQGLH